MPSREDILQELMESFHQELGDRLSSINVGLLALEQQPASEQSKEILEELFRNIHSLKGAARAADLQAIEEMVHGMEDVFGAAKRGTVQLTPALFDLLYQGLDLIGTATAGLAAGKGIDPSLDLPGYLVRLAAAWREQPIQPPQIEKDLPASSPVSSPIEQALQSWGADTIRVPTVRLDELMVQAGELLVTRLRAIRQAEEVRGLNTFAVRWQRDWRRMRRNLKRFLQQSGNGDGTSIRAFLRHYEEQLHTLTSWLGELTHRVAEDAARLSLVTDKLQNGVKEARMLPLATLLSPFRRMVRDLSQEKGVEVILEVRGAETEMDKHVLEQIKDPLMHLLRNCIDHGIEAPEEREARGKPRQGTITLSAERRGSAIVVEVGDDGGGIDAKAIRQAAVRRGLLNGEAIAEMADEQVSSLIFLSGLSTSPIITEVSGRGVGLDVVRRNVEALQGHIDVSSLAGERTTFSLTLPLTLVSTRCMLVRAVGQLFAVPVSAVERMISVDRDDISVVEGKEAIRYRGRALALVRLADVLNLRGRDTPGNGNGKSPAIVLASGGQRIAFLVDELLGGQEIVIKSLGKQLARVRNLAGAAVLGTGKVVLILNVADLVKGAQQTTGQRVLPMMAGKDARKERRTILVVDDSITTRTLEKNILTTAGYEVRLATDGEEALAALVDDHCDLIVADVHMPRLDGFELTQRIRGDERYKHLPVILVTSLESPEQRARGIEVGADAYIAKSTFDQDNLLDTIRQLI